MKLWEIFYYTPRIERTNTMAVLDFKILKITRNVRPLNVCSAAVKVEEITLRFKTTSFCFYYRRNNTPLTWRVSAKTIWRLWTARISLFGHIRTHGITGNYRFLNFIGLGTRELGNTFRHISHELILCWYLFQVTIEQRWLWRRVSQLNDRKLTPQNRLTLMLINEAWSPVFTRTQCKTQAIQRITHAVGAVFPLSLVNYKGRVPTSPIPAAINAALKDLRPIGYVCNVQL